MTLTSHQPRTARTTEWLTPRAIIDALGPFDLDPCAPVTRPWPTAAKHYTIHDNGLLQPWGGRVWLNPPFGDKAGRWLARMVEHGDGVALIPARTETQAWFRYIWPRAHGALFLQGRPHFCDVQGRPAKFNSGVPMVLVGYGLVNAARLYAAADRQPATTGRYVPLRPVTA